MTKLAGDVRAKLALYKLSTFPTVGNINIFIFSGNCLLKIPRKIIGK